jgi:protein phosphatase
MNGFGKTDIGKVRDHNEDAFYCSPENGFFAVADGVGGHNKGEIASAIAIKNIESIARADGSPKTEKEKEKFFRDLFIQIDNDIFEKSNTSMTHAGMATTLILADITEEHFFVANIGDSRGYLLTEDLFFQITDDHSYVSELVKSGSISEEEARRHPKRNVITKALGLGENMLPDFYVGEFREGDLILLCSDGLTETVPDSQIEEMAREYFGDLEMLAEKLVERANENGGDDNITVVVVKK